jgi:hypothetical protein
VHALAQIAARDFEAANPNFAIQKFGFARFTQPATQRNRLGDSGNVFALVGRVAVERQLLRADDEFGIGQSPGLLRATGGGCDERVGLRELRVVAFGEFDGLFKCQVIQLIRW